MFESRPRAFLVVLLMSLSFLLLTAPTGFSQNPPARPATGGSANTTDKTTPAEAATPCTESAAPSVSNPAIRATTTQSATPSNEPPVFTVTTTRSNSVQAADDSAARPGAVKVDRQSPSAHLVDAPGRAADSFGWQQQSPPAPAAFMPLTSEEKMRHAARSAFLSPRAYLFPGVSAIITEATEDDLPQKDNGDRVADGLTRFAIKFGTRSTRVLLASGVFPILFKQDSRYFRSEHKSFGKRTLHAVSRVFVTNSDEGKLQPNYSRFAGTFAASALSNIWEQSTPGHDRIGLDATFKRFGSSFVSDAAFNIINEFLPDIKKIFKK